MVMGGRGRGMHTRIRLLVVYMPAAYWGDACHALKSRQSRTKVPASPLAHLAPHTRFRFIAWLLMTGPLKDLGGLRSIGVLILEWAELMNLRRDTKICDTCRVAHLLRIWSETMLTVYLYEDLYSSPWYHACNCFWSQLAATALGSVPTKPLAKDSAVLRVLYELIVPPWLLVHWVTFRMVGSVLANPVQTFLDLLHGPDHDLFVWDARDETELYGNLVKDDARLGLYTQDWNRYMLEINLETWQQICIVTRTIARSRRDYDTRIRFTAMLLKYSSTLIAFQHILAPLGLESISDEFPFAFMACVVDANYEEASTLTDFKSAEFWATSHLQNWLLARIKSLFHGIWGTSPYLSVLSRVQAMYLILTSSPQVKFGNVYIFTHIAAF
ncbi:hypothetical protein B0H19DRAFT_165975 [Mycena capillaripes]|nr:hypothetical protein B0H19DRAFT_165975 [Mycena capillaripes]